MAKQHELLFKALGVPDNLIKIIEEVKPEEAENFKPEEIVKSIREGSKSLLMNDGDFLKTIPEDKIHPDILKKYESGQYARFTNELIEVATKKLGLDEKKVFTDEDKKSIKKLAEKMATSYLAEKGNTDGLAKMQADLQKALGDLDQQKTEFETKLSTEKEALSVANVGKVLKLLTTIELGKLDKVKLNVPATYITDPLLGKLGNKYNLVLENDQIELRQKENKALKVLDSAGKEISFAQALRSQVLEDKVGEEVKEQQQQQQHRQIIVNPGEEGNGEITTPSYIQDKIDKATALEK